MFNFLFIHACNIIIILQFLIKYIFTHIVFIFDNQKITLFGQVVHDNFQTVYVDGT